MVEGISTKTILVLVDFSIIIILMDSVAIRCYIFLALTYIQT